MRYRGNTTINPETFEARYLIQVLDSRGQWVNFSDANHPETYASKKERNAALQVLRDADRENRQRNLREAAPC